MAYPWKHFIGGHQGPFGTRDDMTVYQRYVDDIIAGVKQALVAVDPSRSSPSTGTVIGRCSAVPEGAGRLRDRAGYQE